MDWVAPVGLECGHYVASFRYRLNRLPGRDCDCDVSLAVEAQVDKFVGTLPSREVASILNSRP